MFAFYNFNISYATFVIFKTFFAVTWFKSAVETDIQVDN